MSLVKVMRDLLSGGTEEAASEREIIPDDPLLRKAWIAQRANTLAKITQKQQLRSTSVVEDAVDSVTEGRRFASRFVATADTLIDDYIKPVLTFFAPLGRLIAYMYKLLYHRFAFNLDEDGKRTEFCRKRSAATVVGLGTGTIVSVYFFFVFVIPNLFLFSYDAVAVNFFAWEDTLVFSKPDWVVDTPGELSVFACRKYPCVGQDDSIEFRMRDSVYLDVIRTFTHFEPHDPGELAGAFLSEENSCTFKAYGVRVKFLRLYPYIIEASCRPINSSGSVTDASISSSQADVRVW